jgi:hypothetical protein
MTKSAYEGSAHALRVDKPGFPRHDVNGLPAFFHQGLRGFNAQALNRAVESEPGLAWLQTRLIAAETAGCRRPVPPRRNVLM